VLRYSAAKEEEEGNGVAVVAFFVALRCSAAPQEEEGDGVAAVAFFAALRCSAAPQEEEEGDGSCRRFLFRAFLRCKKKKKKATTGTVTFVFVPSCPVKRRRGRQR